MVWNKSARRFIPLLVLAAGAFAFGAGCGDNDKEEPTTASPATSETAGTGGSGVTLAAADAAPTIDGDDADWANIEGVVLELVQIEIPAGADWEIDGEVAPKKAVLKVATDGKNIYVLVEVEDSFDYVADNHDLSAALGVMFQIESAAGPHMGSGKDDLEQGLGMVDIWHWELNCAAGALSGGGNPGSGDDPDCNLDDEYATDPETREDDDQATAENSIAGAWTHTAATVGGDGTWIFEMMRPLVTGDATDAQFASGGQALMAIAYWDPKETATGWSDAGHLVSSNAGWTVVTLP